MSDDGTRNPPMVAVTVALYACLHRASLAVRQQERAMLHYAVVFFVVARDLA